MEVDKPEDIGLLIEECQLPPRQQPEQSIIHNTPKEKVLTNCYKIKWDKPITLLHYETKFYVDNGSVLKELSQGLKSDVGKEFRRFLLFKLFSQMLKENPAKFGNDIMKYVYDCGTMMVTTETVPLTGALEKIALDAGKLEIESRDARSYLPNNINELYVTIQFVNEVLIDSTLLRSIATDETSRLGLQLLEIIYNQKIIADNNFHIFPHKSFLKESMPGQRPQDQIQGRVIKDGVAKGVRVCTDEAKNVGLMLQAEVVKSAFYPDRPLVDYLRTRFNLRDVPDFERNFNQIERELKKMTLMTTHLPKNKIFVCDGLDDQRSDRRTFTIDGQQGEVVNIADYMEQKYRLRLVLPDVPCVFVNVRDRESNIRKPIYFPIEVLKIVGGQRVPLQKMDGRFQDDMIRMTRMNPEQMKEATRGVMGAAFLTANNPFAQRFKVPLDSNAIITEAEILPAPSILYGRNVREEPNPQGVLSWRPSQNRNYLIPGRLDKWRVVNYNNCLDRQILEQFIDRLMNKLRERGVQNGQRPDIIIESQANRITDRAQQDGIRFLMIVTKNKTDPIHDHLKHFELRSKIVTQHLWQQTVFNIVKKNQQITLENVVMKTNEKLGGTNFMAISSHLLDSSIGKNGVLEQYWIGSRLFIGLELSHGKGKTSLPSVVGMSYNFNEALSMTGHYFFTEQNKTVIMNLAKELEKPISMYKQRSKSNKWPSHIVIYRSGVSEGEYIQVNRFEKKAILDCFESLAKKNADFVKPGFTFVLAQRNNGFRLIPTVAPQTGGRITDADRNLKPGTCITQGIISPTLEQFIVIAHRTIQGTCRPIMYTVLADQGANGKRIPLGELKYLTFALCHLHNNVLGTVNVPSVLYHAGQVAKRGRNNMKFDQFGSTDDNSINSSTANRVQEAGDRLDYIEALNLDLNVSLYNKYWA